MTQKQLTGRFCDLGIEEKILSILTKKEFETPTPIQYQVIPEALKKRDIVGIAQTGTGKTLAFGIPMIQRIIFSGGQGLVLVPTRELALQVEQSFRQIGAPLGLRSVAIIGGTAQFSQVKALRGNPHIVIATPGRLTDLMEQKIYKLDKICVITLDEADRMLDVGFLPQIKEILRKAPKDRQTMLFSATMPKTIATLAGDFMNMPFRVDVAPQGTPSENIEQEIFFVGKNDKIRLLDFLLANNPKETMLVFSRTKHDAKRITARIRDMGHTVAEIHGNRSQAQRKMALEGFSRGRFRVLVATDIAARGIDVKDISFVVNFDLPDCSEDYVHRIGRTGRAGRSGKAISFATQSQRYDIKKIERLIRKTLKVVSLPVLPPEREISVHAEQPRFSGGRKPFGQRRGGRNSFAKSGQNSSGFHGQRNRSGGNRNNYRKRFAV